MNKYRHRSVRKWAPMVCAVLVLCSTSLWAQEGDTVRTSRVRTKETSSPAKTTKHAGYELPDSLYIAIDSNRGEVDTIVYYRGRDSSVFDLNTRRMILTGEAQLDFRTQHVNAHRIIMDFVQSTLSAASETYDSVITASLEKRRRIIRDTSRVAARGAPKLIDGSAVYEGEAIVYNFETKQGNVSLATTDMEGGYYYGERIKQVEPKTLFVENGRYTTCDAPVPHFYFESPKMKLISGDQVFAEPIYLFIADVPVFALPFAVFPNRGGGRHSGLIAPGYTTTSNRGWGLTHLGYYQVFSDYFDAAFRSDIYTRGGFNLSLQLQYMKRYLLNSPVNLELAYGKTKYTIDDPYSTDFKINFGIPNLVLDPVTNLSASLSFLSNNYNRNNANNIFDIVNQTADSRASFTTTFENIDLSFGMQYVRSQNLRTGEYTETSPSFNWGKITPITPFASAESSETGILQSLQITYSGNASRSVSKRLSFIASDSVRGITGDTSFVRRESYNIRHTPGISISPKLGYFSFNPSFSYGESWYLRRKVKTPRLSFHQRPSGEIDTTVVFDESIENGFYREPTYNYGVSIGTTLYGMANMGGLLGITALRHTLQPSLSFSYNPDFSDRGAAYYTDPKTAQIVRYSIYENDGGYIGSGKSGRIGFSLANDFEMKVKEQVNADSSFDAKVKLLNIGVGSGYDVVQEILSPVSVSAFSQIGNLFSFNAGTTFSWYPQNQFGADSTEHTLIGLNRGLLRVTNTNFSLNGTISSSETPYGENVDSLRRLFSIATPEDERAMFLGGYYPGDFVSLPYRPKWNINYGVTYSESYGVNSVNRNVLGNASVTLNLTQNWSFTTSASYDFAAGRIVVPNIRVHRDLHCWELNFDYRPTGEIKGFNLEIRIKADQLKDIKVTRQESTYGTF